MAILANTRKSTNTQCWQRTKGDSTTDANFSLELKSHAMLPGPSRFYPVLGIFSTSADRSASISEILVDYPEAPKQEDVQGKSSLDDTT